MKFWQVYLYCNGLFTKTKITLFILYAKERLTKFIIYWALAIKRSRFPQYKIFYHQVPDKNFFAKSLHVFSNARFAYCHVDAFEKKLEEFSDVFKKQICTRGTIMV